MSRERFFFRSIARRLVGAAPRVLMGLLLLGVVPSLGRAEGFSYEVQAGMGMASSDISYFDPANGTLDAVTLNAQMDFHLTGGITFDSDASSIDLTLSFDGMVDTPGGGVPLYFETMLTLGNISGGISEFFSADFSDQVSGVSLPTGAFVGTGTFPLTVSWNTTVQFQWIPGIPATLDYLGGTASGSAGISYAFTPPPPQDYHWDNPAGGGFSTATNWSSDTVPGVIDTARIDLGGTYNVNLSEDVTTDRLIIGNGGAQANPTLDLGSHTYTTSLTNVGNMGSLDLDGSTSGARLKTDTLLIDSGSSMSGAGWIQPRPGGAAVTTFENMGTLSPGLSSESNPVRTLFTNTGGGPEPDEFYAHLVVRGDYTQDAAATMNVVLNASKAVNQSQSPDVGPPPLPSADLLVTASANLGGTVNVTFADGYEPQHGDSFTLVESSTNNIASGFDTYNLPIAPHNGLPLQVIDQTSERVSVVVPQKVVLAWGHDLPVGLEPLTIFGQTITSQNAFGSEDAFNVTGSEDEVIAFSAFQSALLQRVQQQYDMSGIHGVVFTAGDPEPNAINVYFIDSTVSPGLLGKAYTGIDRLNPNAEGEAVVLVNSFNAMTPFNVELDAETVAHEVGHLLGLRHVDPPGAISIMDYDITAGDVELFQDGVFNIRESPKAGGTFFPDTHNPVYHLKRYIDGVPHEDLVAQGTLPGTWDLPGPVFEDLDTSFLFSVAASSPGTEGVSPAGMGMTLYDVLVVKTESDPTTPDTLATFAEITLAELAQQSFRINEGEGIGIFASSTLGGEYDIALAPGDPFTSHALIMYPGLDELQGFLQMESTAPAGYDTLFDVTILATVVPDNVPGDGNGDGKVDGLDYLLWAGAFGDDPAMDPPGSPENGDYNNDGVVSGLDYLVWASNFGQGPNDVMAVPEPVSLSLLVFGCVAVAVSRRRDRKRYGRQRGSAIRRFSRSQVGRVGPHR